MFVIQSDELATTVNLLNSHGDLEQDFWIDARLYDAQGQLVASRKQWLLAKRFGLSRGDIADLLPDPKAPFTGHIALNFSDLGLPVYPRRLQALLEYRSALTTSRIMAWSDVWNSRPEVIRAQQSLAGFFPIERVYNEKPLPDGCAYGCHYRVWASPDIISLVAVSNCGLTDAYAAVAHFTLRLFNQAGSQVAQERVLAPHATLFASAEELFQDVEDFLAPSGVGLLSIESRSDLAAVHFSQHKRSGAWSAEHFMATDSFHDGTNFIACGS